MKPASPPLPRRALREVEISRTHAPVLPVRDHPFDVALRAALSDEPRLADEALLDLTLPSVVIAPRLKPPPMVPLPSLVPMVPIVQQAIEPFDSTTAAAESPPGRLELVLRICVASLFAVNGISAFIDPEPFVDLLLKVPILGMLPMSAIDGLVWFAGLNDLLLAVAIVCLRRRRLVYVWMAMWLASIAAVKVLGVL